MDCSNPTNLRTCETNVNQKGKLGALILTMKSKSFVTVFANAMENPAKEALMAGLKTAMQAIAPRIHEDKTLNLMDNHLLTVEQYQISVQKR